MAAGSAFAILQSMGMVAAVAIPAAGAAIVGTTAVVAAHQQGVLRGANAAGGEVARWWGGDYGEPVKNWWNGNFGQPVKSWLGATEKPVANWWGQVTRQNTAQN